MIILRKNLKNWTTEKPCDGVGKVFCEEILNADLTAKAAEIVLFCTLEVGGKVGVHKHEGSSEAWVILEGEAKVWDGENEVYLKPGDTNYCEEGNSHGIENVGNTELKYLGIKFPSTK